MIKALVGGMLGVFVMVAAALLLGTFAGIVTLGYRNMVGGICGP